MQGSQAIPFTGEHSSPFTHHCVQYGKWTVFLLTSMCGHHNFYGEDSCLCRAELSQSLAPCTSLPGPNCPPNGSAATSWVDWTWEGVAGQQGNGDLFSHLSGLPGAMVADFLTDCWVPGRARMLDREICCSSARLSSTSTGREQDALEAENQSYDSSCVLMPDSTVQRLRGNQLRQYAKLLHAWQ